MNWTDLQTGVVFQSLLRGSVKQKAMTSAGLAHPKLFNLYACLEFFDTIYGNTADDPNARRMLRGLMAVMQMAVDESENAFAERIQKASFPAFAGADPRERMDNELWTFMYGLTDRSSQMVLHKAYDEGTISNITEALQELKKLTPVTLRDLDQEVVGLTSPLKRGKGKATGPFPGVFAAVNKGGNQPNRTQSTAANAGSTQSKNPSSDESIPERLDGPRFKKLSSAEKERLDELTSKECRRVCVTCGATGHLPSECFGRDGDLKKLHACRGRYCKKINGVMSRCKCECGGHFGDAANPPK